MIERKKYLEQLLNKKDNHLIKVITGVRRSGKSYLLFNLYKQKLLDLGVSSDHIICIQLDDTDFLAYRNPLKLGEYIRSQIKDNLNYYVFIDEIQFCKKVKNPYVENDSVSFYEVLNGLLKHENVDTYVTGSNSKLLSSDVLTEFRGRGDEIHVRPLSFKEFYDYKKGDFDVISFSPKINKETRQESIDKADINTDTKATDSATASDSTTAREVQGEPVQTTSTPSKGYRYDPKTGQWISVSLK